MSAKDKLSQKQQRFCEEYIKDANGKQAAIRAGYAPKAAKEQASDLLTRPNLRAYLDELRAPITEKAIVTAEFVLTSLVNVAKKCQKPEPVMEFDPVDKQMVQKRDEETGELLYEFDSSGANKALELLGKHLRLFTDKVEHTIDLTISDRFSRAEERLNGKE